MENSNKPTPILGSILLLAAAFFSLALILQVFDFGLLGPEQDNIFYFIGNMLISVYGFTSILIPTFLLLAALSCFASKWTSKKSMMLLTAVIPFFTSFGFEKLCKAILSSQNIDYPVIKAIVVAIIGLMLIVIEILLAGVFAEKINSLIYGVPQKQNQKNFVSVKEKYHSVKNLLDEENKPESENEENFQVQNEIENPPETENTKKNEEKVLNFDKDETENSQTETEIQENSENPFENIFDESKVTDVTAEQDEENDFDEKNPASIITQEEYQALTFQDEQNSENENDYSEPEENDVDELEWPDTAEIRLRSGSEKPQKIVFDRSKDEYSEDFKNSTSDSDFNENQTEMDEQNFENPDEKDFSDSEIENNSDDENLQNPQDEAYNSLNPDFFDIDMNSEDSYSKIENQNETEDEKNDFSDDFEIQDENELETEEKIDDDEDKSIFEDLDDVIAPSKSILSDVFKDMEEDAEEQVGNIKIRLPQNEASTQSEQSQNDEIQEVQSESSKKSDTEPEYIIPTSQNNLSGSNNASAVEVKRVLQAPPMLNRNAFRGPYKVPTDILGEYENDQYWLIDEQTKHDAQKLKATLDEFGISAQVIGIKKGPVVTMFELLPAPGVRLSKIVGLQDNIALSLAASSVRIVAPIPGKAAVGIEVPNKKRSIVSFREILEQNLPEFEKMAIPVILGKDILGKSQIIDIARTPHLLIAGATGSGKSVCVNSLILSILYKRSPRQVKLLLIDPKVVELKLYNDIPHLLTPVITEPKKAIQALQYCIAEMERRYSLLDSMGVRDIIGYNARIEERHIATEKLPYIVVIIDEFADLMATSGKELENDVARLTAKSRAAGIHLVLATQRPSVNVITGLIKANIPSRIAFMVTSRTDSNIIIDSVGAEKLLGKGDMLYASAVDPYPVRIQGTFETDQDVEKVVDYVKTLGEPEYIDDEIFVDDEDENDGQQNLFSEGDDPLYEQALDVVMQSGKASASYIQRRLRIGYNRAARLVEEMEERGIVGPANGSKPREIIHMP